MTDTHFTFSSLPANNCSSMNTFKTVLVICAMLSACASCSSSYQSSDNQGSQATAAVDEDVHGGVMGSQSTAFANQQNAVPDSTASGIEHQRPAFDFERVRPLIGAAASPTTTQYICSCITINPVAPISPHPAVTAGDSLSLVTGNQQAIASQQESIAGPASFQSASVEQQSVGGNRGY